MQFSIFACYLKKLDINEQKQNRTPDINKSKKMEHLVSTKLKPNVKLFNSNLSSFSLKWISFGKKPKRLFQKKGRNVNITCRNCMTKNSSRDLTNGSV